VVRAARNALMNAATTYTCRITPLGEGGIGIVALWGPGAAALLERFFAGSGGRSASELRPGQLAHGHVRRDGRTLDEVILARIASPFPGLPEPYFEVNSHGGVAAVRAVQTCFEEAGAEPIQWEKLFEDPAGGALSPAGIRMSARRELPRAPTRLAATMLLHQEAGALARELARIENLSRSGASGRAREALDALLSTWPLGRALLNPPRVALLGPPNAGKSTLFNALLDEERVIVHHEPGTTRDVIVETVSIRGVPFDLMDAAGIRRPEDEVEREAVRRARALAGKCEVALVVFDVREGFPADLGALPRGIRIIPVANKIDLLSGPRASDGEPGTVRISARERTNLTELEDALLEPYRDIVGPCRRGGPVVFSEDMRVALARAAHHGGLRFSGGGESRL